MHAKHRNGPGNNGYRSNAMGMGSVAAASRIPPEDSIRGRRMYNSEFNRVGYGGGGQSRQFPPPSPAPREADIFVEAGRLAAEYLVSKGVLPPNALSGKWQSDGLKNNFQGFRSFGVEKVQSPVDGRPSALSRLGSAGTDVGPGRRRYSDEMDSRSSVRGRKRTGSFKNYGSEVNRELGRSGSWTEKVKAEADSDSSVQHHDDGKNGTGGIHNSSPREITQEVGREVHIESGLEKCNLVGDADANANDSNLSDKKCLTSDAVGEPIKKSDASNKLSVETEVVNDLQKRHDESKDVTVSVKEESSTSEERVDLLKHCKFVNVPTRARSSSTSKGSKGDQDPTNEGADTSKIHVIDVDVDNSAGNASSQHNHEFKSLQSDVPKVEKELDVAHTTWQGQFSRSGSFPERSVHKEQQTDEGLAGFGRSNSMFVERGEKRAINFNTDGPEDFKKLKQSDNSPPPSSMENQPMVQEPRSSKSADSTLAPKQKSLDKSLFPKDHADSCDLMEEKQLFPGPFRTLDLNLVGSSDVSGNHDAGSVFVFPSVMQTGSVATTLDVDLSMSNNGNLPNKNGKHVNDNDIEVIDLEKDSAQDYKSFSNPERRGDTVFSDLDGFPNNVHNPNGIPDVQDGFGLMISELLGNDSPNCSSVPTDLNSLHNRMGLPNDEAILGDDESIYMSLGEIPISLLGPWEQAPQDYGKPF